MKAVVPELRKFVGRCVLIPEFIYIDNERVKLGETRVEIREIVGSRVRPQFYEINGEHLIGMLRFHAQMQGATDIPEEDFRDFEEMEFTAERMPGTKIIGAA